MWQTLLTLWLLLVLVCSETNWDVYKPKYHFLPEHLNWMNDPNGPFYDPLFNRYHLFYQYSDPRVWGHAVSEDLMHWRHLPVALATDEWYDKGGVWSGSATLLTNTPDFEDNTPVLTYAVSSNNMIALAFPKNRYDPDLVEWVKYKGNPIISNKIDSPPGRDPTTAWRSADGKKWRMAYGTTPNPGVGNAVVFSTTDFVNWETGYAVLAQGNTGNWECPDFFPLVNPNTTTGATHTSMDVTRRDKWMVGSYDDEKIAFIPLQGQSTVEDDQQFDYGWFYASFFDSSTSRQIIWGWLPELRPACGDCPGTFAGAMSLPRSITLDGSGKRLNTIPVEETVSLRQNITIEYSALQIPVGSSILLSKISGKQLEIIATFATKSTTFDCGITVLASPGGEEYTNIGIKKDQSGKKQVYINNTKASLNAECTKQVFSAALTDQSSTLTTLRIFVDHSIVESFANSGDIAITSRAYPTLVKETVGVLAFAAPASDCQIISLNAWPLSDSN